MKVNGFSASNRWLHRFKLRHGIRYHQISGEAEAVDKDSVCTWLNGLLPALLVKFAAKDIFNADEFGLFFKLMPDKSFIHKDEKCVGGKLSKERLTVLACANSDGLEKLPLLIIGKSKNPRCFKHVKTLPAACTYNAQTKAWMTGNRFSQWLKEVDIHMMKQNRKILLIIDNCPAHPKDVPLNNVQVEFLPANTTVPNL